MSRDNNIKHYKNCSLIEDNKKSDWLYCIKSSKGWLMLDTASSFKFQTIDILIYGLRSRWSKFWDLEPRPFSYYEKLGYKLVEYRIEQREPKVFKKGFRL
jgi:hypothetical protein